MAIALVLLKFLAPDISSPWLLTIGRLHPVVLHFPIVILGILLLAEMIKLYGGLDIHSNWMKWGFVLASLSVVVSIKTGYLLYASGEYSGILMDQHFNGALITGVLTFISFLFFLLFLRKGKFYFYYVLSLLAANIFTVYTGHQGASITHGENYLTEYFSIMGKSKSTLPGRDSVSYFYSDVMQPILDFKCAGCHNTLRAKGGLSVSYYSDLFKKGESGIPGITKNDTLKSEIYRRVMLRDTASEHMPPPGKIGLTRDEIFLLKFWIQAGAYEELRTDAIEYAPLKDRITQLKPALKKYKLNIEKEKFNKAQIKDELLFQAKELEVIIKEDDKDENGLFTLSNKFPPAPFDSRKLKELKPYLGQFSKVSLVSSQLDDADLYLISQMDNVRELYLQKTKIKGFGLLQLSRLKNLEVLNVSFTELSDKDLIDLIRFPALKEVYVYGTKVTNDVIKAVNSHKPALVIHSEEGPYF